MKNLKILATAVVMTISSLATAQNENLDDQDNLKLGIKAGLNFSNVYDENENSFAADGKFGFVGGLLLHVPISEYLGFQPEVLYSQKGFKGNGTLFGSNYSFTRTTSYIEFPLQLAIRPTEYLTILAGPQYSFLINQKDEFNSNFGTATQEEEIKNDNIRKNILGFTTGLDVNLDDVIIGLRMGWDFQNNNGNGTSDTPRYKNVWVQTTIGYTLFN
ncbi:porin family protein [Marivirga salinae]|uniref:Porin family protein n=1 Tax=Marivirga salinarum TaxID=3059078 RepID=A0AA51RA70_9BACT|nr:porin family protein [Marivirga sp. BDSF4-3]WMN10831.1 porin family protein [Marivirga sp. BDSF4-3]